MIGATALMPPAASVISVAPCLIKSLVPAARGSSGEPGTAKTSRPCSAAMRAVMSDPERCAASTTTTPSATPEISRLRRGKSRARGPCPRGISEIAAPAPSNACEQIHMFGRIDAVVAAGQHRYGAAVEAQAVRRLIDAARQARGNDKTGLAKIMRQLAGNFQARARSIAGTDDRDHRPHQHFDRAAHAEQGRHASPAGQPRRINRLTQAQPDRRPSLLLAASSAPCVVLAADTPGTRGAAAPRQIGQALQRGARAAEMIDQRAEGARSDIVGPDQPQPVDPLLRR